MAWYEEIHVYLNQMTFISLVFGIPKADIFVSSSPN